MADGTTIEAELYDGTILEFPAGTSRDVIARVAKEQTFLKQTSDMIQNPAAPEEPELTAGRAAGLAGRTAVQAAPGAVAGLPALAWDGTYGFLRNMGTQLANVKRRAFGEEALPYRDPFETSNAVTKTGELAADALGLPKPESDVERTVVASGQTALEALGGAKLAQKLAQKVPETIPAARRVLTELGEAPATQAAIGGLAGGGAQVAAENDINPLLGTAGGLALGLGGVAAGHGIRQGVQSGRQMASRALARGEDVQQQLAAERIRNAASNPEAAYRELDEGAGAELVPGSKPTTFQATGDMGLGSLERELQTANPEAFAQRRGAQNSARLASLRSVGGEGNADELTVFLRSQLDEIDRVTLGDEAAARSAAEEAAERIRPVDSADGLGRSIRGSMRDAEDAARAKESALWNAVDPDGSLTVSTQSAKQIADEVYKRLSQAGQLGLSADEKNIVDLIGRYRSAEPFRELQDLSSRIKGVMREEMRQRGRTPAYARLAQLNQAVRSGMENTAYQQIAADPVARGRFQSLVDEFTAGSGEGIGSGNSAAGALRAGAVSGMGREAATQGSGPGSFAGAPRVQDQARQGGKALSLSQFIARNGGLPLDAETAARDWGNANVKGYGRLARPDGRSIDGYWRNKLIDAGYLPPDADGYSSRDITRELFRALEDERAGRKTFAAADEMRGAGSVDLDGYEAELQAAAKQIREDLGAVGVRSDEVSTRALNEAADMLARGDERDAVTAYERAVMGLDDEGPVRATYPTREAAPSRSIFETFQDDPDAGRRYKAATEGTRERISTYQKGYAGQVLRRDGDKETFRMGDASVAANAFRLGPTGGERIKALVRAGAKPSEVTEAAAHSLYKMAVKADGTIDPKKFQRWRSAHADALRELPEDVRARFANASLASQALERAAATRKARLEEFNKSVLGRLAKVDPADLSKEIGGILNARDAGAKMSKLAKAAKSSQSARDGLRRAVAEYIEARFISNKEVGASGENAIRADAFASFVKDKAPALRQVFSGEELLRMQGIAGDIKRAERSLQAVRLPGNSNTPADIGAALDKHAEKAGKHSLLSQIIVAAGGGALIGDFTGAAVGAAGAGAKHVLGSMRATGMKRVDDLVLEMMLDPALAKAALLKRPIADKAAQQVLSHALAKRSPFAVSASVGGSNER